MQPTHYIQHGFGRRFFGRVTKCWVCGSSVSGDAKRWLRSRRLRLIWNSLGVVARLWVNSGSDFTARLVVAPLVDSVGCGGGREGVDWAILASDYGGYVVELLATLFVGGCGGDWGQCWADG